MTIDLLLPTATAKLSDPVLLVVAVVVRGGKKEET